MSAHTPAPWKPSTRGPSSTAVLCRDFGDSVLCYGDARDANAARIVACVNACEGVPTEVLLNPDAHGELRHLYVKGRDERDRLAALNAELLAALDRIDQAAGSLTEDANPLAYAFAQQAGAAIAKARSAS